MPGVFWLVAALTAVRLGVAAIVPLAPDETYYWVWSRALAPGYLDHPPMVALWIRAGTWVLGHNALGVRLLGPFSTALASWLLFDAGRRLFPGTRAGSSAVLLLNASLLLGVGSVIMTPDTPLLFFWTAALWALARVAAGGGGAWWLAAGAFGGLALDSKYTALLLWVGTGVWVLAVPSMRHWVRRWQPYAAAALGFALFCPVLWWNAEHGWAGVLKQGGRVADWQPSRAAGFLAELVGSQLGLVTPVVLGLCMVGLGASVRRWRDPAWGLLAALSLPGVAVFVQHAVGDRVQGNWPAVIYPALVVAAGAACVSRRWVAAAVWVGLVMTSVAYLQATVRLVPLPVRLDPVAIRLAGWDALAGRVQAWAVDRGAAFIAADGYALGSELAWHAGGVPVVGVDDRWRLTALPIEPLEGRTGLLVRDARRTDLPAPAAWGSAEMVGVVVRPGTGEAGFAVFRVVPPAGAGAVLLPR
jgi:hypothetical protein